MLNLVERKPQFTRYAIGGAVAVVILFAWISIPLMQSSPLDSSVGTGGFFKSRTADVNSLGSEIPQEGGAPGYSLNGGMLNNPVTSGENIAATLFQSGPSEEGAPEDLSAGAFASAVQVPDAPAPSGGAAGAAAAPGIKAKMSMVPSMGSGGANTMTIGGTHDKFFGSGAGVKKEDVLAASAKNVRRPDLAQDRKGALVAGLEKMSAKSSLASRSVSADGSRDGASSAFDGGVKTRSASLNTAIEAASQGAGISMDAAAQDLKRNDPSMSSKKITIPEPKVDKDKEADEEMKKMILQMLMSSLLGGLFSGQ